MLRFPGELEFLPICKHSGHNKISHFSLYRILLLFILLTQFVYQNFRTKLQFKVWEVMKEEKENELKTSYNYRLTCFFKKKFAATFFTGRHNILVKFEVFWSKIWLSQCQRNSAKWPALPLNGPNFQSLRLQTRI